MAYPFTDKSSSYIEAYGFLDRTTSSLPLASSLNGLVSAISGITVPASAINNVISGATTAVNGTSLTNLVSGLTTAVNGSSLTNIVSGATTAVNGSSLTNLLSGLDAGANGSSITLAISGLGAGVDASSLNLLSGISAQASSINNIQGLTASGAASILNNSLYLGTANTRLVGMYSANTPIDGLSVTAVTAFGLASIAFIIATINLTGTPTTTGAIVNVTIDPNSTAVTFAVHGHDGSAVTAGIATGLVLNAIAIGS